MELEDLLKDVHFLGKISASIRNIICGNFPQTTAGEREDIDQEVKLKLWRLATGGKKIGNIRSYLWRVVYTTALDVISKRLNSMPFEEALETEHLWLSDRLDLLPPDRLMEKRELKGMIESAVESLPEKRRLVIKLYLTGMGIEDAAAFLGWSENKVRHLLYRGLHELREEFEEGTSRKAQKEPTPPPLRRRLVLGESDE